MSKDPTPRADALRAQREQRYGHLQAHVIVEEKSSDVMAEAKKMMKSSALIPYAGKDRREGTSRHGGIPYSKNPKPDGPKSPRKRAKQKRKIA